MEFSIGVIVGFVVAAFLSESIIHKSEQEAYKANRDLIQQCEAELPRNQHCKLTAVPEEEGE